MRGSAGYFSGLGPLGLLKISDIDAGLFIILLSFYPNILLIIICSVSHLSKTNFQIRMILVLTFLFEIYKELLLLECVLLALGFSNIMRNLNAKKMNMVR